MKKFTLLFLALASLSFSSAQAADDFDTSKLPPFGPRVNPDDQYRFSWMIPVRYANGFFNAGVNLVMYFPYPGCIRAWATQDVDYVVANWVKSSLRKKKPDENSCTFNRYGKPGKGFDVNRPPVFASLTNIAYRSGLSLTNLPSIVACRISGEESPTVSWSPEVKEMCKRDLGFEVPPPDTFKGTKGFDFPIDHIIEDDDKQLRFKRWCHDRGTGMMRLNDVGCREMMKGIGRPLYQWYDPVARSVPMWHPVGGHNANAISHWAYTEINPLKFSYCAAEIQSLARADPSIAALFMIQGFSYTTCTPSGTTITNPPAWYLKCKNPGGITAPPDTTREAQWFLFARRLDGYGIYDSGVIYPKASNPQTFLVLSNLYNTVGIPLGPLLKAVPERPPVAAVLESHASALIAGTSGSWGWGSKLGDVLTCANLMPYVLFEDEIKRDGIPASMKLIVLDGCSVLTRTSYEALKRFQDRGGILVSDGPCTPALLPDFPFPTNDYLRDRKNAHVGRWGRAAAEKKLRENLGSRLTPYADCATDDIILHTRTYRTADYVFAINDKRVWGDYVGQWKRSQEKGEPNEGVVTVARADTKAVYDLVRHVEVPFKVANGKTEIAVSYTTCDGRIFLVVPQKLGALTIRRDGDDVLVTSNDKNVMIPIKVEVDGQKPRYGVVAGGVWKRPYAKGANLRVTNLADGRMVR